ncbi:MAG: glycosyltransferase [Candidatus Pacearchaeota archaeon]|nr:glycosyltransferase [Candidatus Pacearchaeota archaeon]
MKTKEKLSIIIPAYNEEKRIARTLKEYCSFFKEKKKSHNLNFEIIVVINNTTDKTEDIVKSYQKSSKELKYLNFKQGGKGFAVIEGFKEALKDKENSFIGFVDADCSTSPQEFFRLFNNIKNYDGIIASRYLSGAIVKPKPSFQRIIASRIFNFLIRVLFFMPYKDTQCGAKIFKRKVIEKIINKIGITQWAFDVDLLYKIKKEGFKIKEFPTIWAETDNSKLNLKKASIQMFFAILRLKILNSSLKIFWKVLNPIGSAIYKLLK